MKKVLSIILIISMLLCIFAGCGGDGKTSVGQNPTQGEQKGTENLKPTGDAGDHDETTSPAPQLEKLKEDVIATSVISEGIAVVSCDKNSTTCYGIGLDGTIKFELDLSSDFNLRNLSDCAFVNGLMLIDGGFCDMKGNMTYPKDVGVSNFYAVALEEGYIFADVITASYDGTKTKMGIMDTSFQWLVEPNEEIYQELGTSLGMHIPNDGCYCIDGYVYISRIKKFVKLDTGIVLNDAEGPQRQPSHSWSRSRVAYSDRNGNVVLDLTGHKNLQSNGKFVNGVGTLVFYNEQAKQHFITAIDENGEFLFAPVQFDEQGKGTGKVSIATDGTIIIAYEDYYGAGVVRSYDMMGNLLGEIDAETLDDNSISVSIEDGVIVFRLDTLYGEKDTWLFNEKMEPLF